MDETSPPHAALPVQERTVFHARVLIRTFKNNNLGSLSSIHLRGPLRAVRSLYTVQNPDNPRAQPDRQLGVLPPK